MKDSTPQPTSFAFDPASVYLQYRKGNDGRPHPEVLFHNSGGTLADGIYRLRLQPRMWHYRLLAVILPSLCTKWRAFGAAEASPDQLSTIKPWFNVGEWMEDSEWGLDWGNL
jgi:hypothetical protein